MTERTRYPVAMLVAGLLLSAVLTAALAKDTISDGKVVRWVAKAVAERQPPAEDKRFDEVGWVTDIRTAIQLGKQYNRPIFLLTVDGRVNTGRC